MNTVIKWVLALLLAWAFVLSVRADEVDKNLKKILNGKEVEYAGTCRLDKAGMLTFEADKVAMVMECVVGYDKKDRKLKYVLLFSDKGPSRLILFNLETRAQKDLWKSEKDQV